MANFVAQFPKMPDESGNESIRFALDILAIVSRRI